MVWMLPIKIDVPVLLYNTEHEAEKVFPFGRDMTYQGYYKVLEGSLDLDEYISRTETKLKMYFGE